MINTKECNEEAEVNLIKFGSGDKAVAHGFYGGEPAVFIEDSDLIGVVGSFIEPQPDLNTLKNGATILIFPTIEQAKLVADALCNNKPAVYMENIKEQNDK